MGDRAGDDPSVGESTGTTVPIAAIGASAGGLDALRRLFKLLPDDTGMAFVVIQHLDPDRPSSLSSVLAGEVSMPVVEVTGEMAAEADHVYVIPPGGDLSIQRGRIKLSPRSDGRLHLPIDAFFRALADDIGASAIGVVLSGSGTDGTEGLRAIKAAGGIAMAQDPDTAQFRSMPESAVAEGLADVCLPPEGIAGELARFAASPYFTRHERHDSAGTPISPDDESGFASILSLVRQHAHLDFRGYKRPTLMRRVARRMALRRVGSRDEYAEMLRQDPAESRALAEDILIHVTSFFRDPGAFDALKHHVLRDIVRQKEDDATVRVWVPGCSTGEEAYSIAISLVEVIAEERRELTLKVFGSDLSGRAIETARAARYSDADVECVGPERVARFFERSQSRYRVTKEIRDLCVFVRHDITRDPPFAKLDLISCRNLLIYFDAELQRRVVPLLHHCLNTPGYLFLGSSESLREFDQLFVPVDKHQRIYLKTGESPRIEYPLAFGCEGEAGLPTGPSAPFAPAREARREADHIRLARYAPPGVVVNERFEVVQFCGRTGAYLEPPPGLPQTSVLYMARQGLVSPLRDALEAAKARLATVRRQGVQISAGSHDRLVTIEVIPLASAPRSAESYFLVIFEETAGRESTESDRPRSGPTSDEAVRDERADEEFARLRAELAATRDYLQAVTAEHQIGAEELTTTNDELVAANEELQSTNEELQSAQEELQSTNEELSTINDELEKTNQELDQVANDLVNVLDSVKIPIIMVDRALRVRRFTPNAREISSLRPGDEGRSIEDVKLKFKADNVVERTRETIESLSPQEFEAESSDGRWVRLHVRPYRTADNRVDGAVLSCVDIDDLRRAVDEAERVRDYAERIVSTVPMPLVVLDHFLSIVSANPAFCRSVPISDRAARHAKIFELADGAWDVPELRESIEIGLSARAPFQGVEIACDFPGNDKRAFVVSGCPLHGSGGDVLLLLAIEDITSRRLLEASEKRARLDAEHANRAKDVFLATLSHELRTPLNTILLSAQLLQATGNGGSTVEQASQAIERAVKSQARLIDDLLDVSRIVTGKLILELQSVDLTAVVRRSVENVRSSANSKGIRLDLAIAGPIRSVRGDPERLQQVVTNLLNNAVKFTPSGGWISVRLEADDQVARITVTDTGKGLSPDIIPRLFNRFVQAESAMTRGHGGLGLGLSIVRHIVEVHGGEVKAESPGEGLGSTFTVTLPFGAEEALAAPVSEGTVARTIRGVRVLLIEDDDDAREACASMLRGQGAEVRAAESAEAGLAALESFEPQVILSDIAMPGEDGYSFVQKLRQTRRGREIPVAALTALASDEDRQRSLEAGFDLHLAKPIDAERLAIAIGTLVAR